MIENKKNAGTKRLGFLRDRAREKVAPVGQQWRSLSVSGVREVEVLDPQTFIFRQHVAGSNAL